MYTKSILDTKEIDSHSVRVYIHYKGPTPPLSLFFLYVYFMGYILSPPPHHTYIYDIYIWV